MLASNTGGMITEIICVLVGRKGADAYVFMIRNRFEKRNVKECYCIKGGGGNT